jgi:uncharacterized protein (TIGR03437 family)
MAASCAVAQQVVRAVVNGASYSTSLAPGTWAVIYGTALAPEDGSSGGVSVTVGGVNAPLVFVSPGQINALIPLEAASLNLGQQASLPLAVTAPAGLSAPFMVKLSRVAPAIFTQNGAGTGAALAWDANFQPLSIVGSGGLGPASSSGVNDSLNVLIGDVTAKGPVSNGVYLIENGVWSNTATARPCRWD